MAALVHFIADPPQWARFQRASPQPPGGAGYEWSNGDYLVGDRLSHWHTGTGAYSNYRCTVAGNPGGAGWIPNGASPYVWGGTTWTLIAGGATSWADAGTRARDSYINYVDCNLRGTNDLPNGSLAVNSILTVRGPLAYIFVEPSTMKPTPSVRDIIGFGTGPIFFPSIGSVGGFHGRNRFGSALPLEPKLGIDTKGEAFGTSGPYSWGNYTARGVDVRYKWNGTFTYFLGGVANKVDTTGTSGTLVLSENGLSITEGGQHRFGVHVEHGGGATLLGANVYSTLPVQQQRLFSSPLAYTSDASFAQGQSQWGSQGSLIRVSNIYRTGAASAPETDHSYQFGALALCTPGVLHTTPFVLFHNTLTGARTLTLHVLTDSPWDNDFTNLDLWADVFYPSSATNAKYTLITSENANWGVPAAVGTVLTTDSAGWTYSGIFFPTAFKITFSISPQRAGFIFVRFNIGSYKASRYLVFIDPFFEIA